MIQTLYRRGCADIANTFGCVLIDEAHQSRLERGRPSSISLAARYKFGVTATAWRKDRLDAVMWRTIGPITAGISAGDVVAAGKIVEPTITTVETRFFFDLQDGVDWSRMLTSLARDSDRNQLIAADVRERLTPGTKALILTDRIDHVNRLADILAQHDPVVLTGDVSNGEREAAMVEIRRGAPLTIATASLLGEGIDVPGWDLLFMASPMAGGPRTCKR